MRYAHFAEICENCGNTRNVRQSHIRIKLTCLARTARGNVRSTRASIVQSHEQARRGHGSSLEQRVASYVARRLRPRCCHLGSIDVKTFLRFLFWSRFYVFNVFLFSKRFLFFKKRWQSQSGKQTNKKHFQNNSNEIQRVHK